MNNGESNSYLKIVFKNLSMKKLILLCSMLCSLFVIAQDRSVKNDIIVTKDGQLIQAKVVKVTESAISFNYPGETVINEVDASKLEKIVFSSGRTQLFGSGQNAKQTELPAKGSEPIPQEEIYIGSASEYTSGPSYTQNELTVLPLSYVKNGVHSKKLSNQMTSFVTAFMASNAKPYGVEVKSMEAAIESLVDADIGYNKLATASPAELRQVLGSEFLLRAKLTDNTDRGNSSNVYSADESSGYKTGIHIELELFSAEDDNERYEVSFSEEISLKQPTALLEGKWKSSIKYVLQQLLSARSF